MDAYEFEKMPGSANTVGERPIPPNEDFEKSFAEGDVPEFAGGQFGVAQERNGETVDSGLEYGEGLANAAALINFGLDAAAREKGVEAVVQGVKSFDATGLENPVERLYEHLGIDFPEGYKDLREEAKATSAEVEEFREGGKVASRNKSVEGALKAILDMKELIAEVEGADPRYEELRAGARAAGMGYFEYAVKKYERRGLTDLFTVLTEQREKTEDEKNDIEDNAEDESTEDSEMVPVGLEKEKGQASAEESEVGARLNPEILEEKTF